MKKSKQIEVLKQIEIQTGSLIKLKNRKLVVVSIKFFNRYSFYQKGFKTVPLKEYKEKIHTKPKLWLVNEFSYGMVSGTEDGVKISWNDIEFIKNL